MPQAQAQSRAFEDAIETDGLKCIGCSMQENNSMLQCACQYTFWRKMQVRQLKRKVTDNPVVLRIMDQLKLQNKTEKELVRHLGLSDSAFSSWKFKNGKGYEKRIDEIASFLGVTKQYLYDGIDEYINGDTITPSEIRLLKNYRKMGDEQKKNYMKMGEFLVMSTDYERLPTLEESNE